MKDEAREDGETRGRGDTGISFPDLSLFFNCRSFRVIVSLSPPQSSSFILPPSSFLSPLVQGVAALAVKVVEIFGLDRVVTRLADSFEQGNYFAVRCDT